MTALRCASRVYTDHAVFDVGFGGAVVRETFGVSLDELRGWLDVPVVEH